MGALLQWLHFERLSEKGAEKRERRKRGGEEGGGEVSGPVCGCLHDGGWPVLWHRDWPGKLTCGLRKRLASSVNDLVRTGKGLGRAESQEEWKQEVAGR